MALLATNRAYSAVLCPSKANFSPGPTKHLPFLDFCTAAPPTLPFDRSPSAKCLTCDVCGVWLQLELARGPRRGRYEAEDEFGDGALGSRIGRLLLVPPALKGSYCYRLALGPWCWGVAEAINRELETPVSLCGAHRLSLWAKRWNFIPLWRSLQRTRIPRK